MKSAAVVPLEKATPANSGAKAAACAQLATAAAKSGFRTPAGVCVPFGCMEAAVKVRSPNSYIHTNVSMAIVLGELFYFL